MKGIFNTLSRQIGSGFALVILVLALAVGVTLWKVQDLNNVAQRITNQSVPTTKICLQITDGVNHSIAALRGFMIVHDSSFQEERQLVWKNKIHAPFNQLKTLHGRSPDSVKKARLDALEVQLDQLENYQKQVEKLSLTAKDEAIALLESKGVSTVAKIRKLLNLTVNEVENSLKSDFSTIDNEITALTKLEWALLVLGILLSIFIGIFIARSISRPVAEAVVVADNVAAGDLATEIKVGGSKELDSLGEALLKMRNALKTRATEAERYNWLSSGQNQLSKVMRGDKDVEELADDITAFMAEYTGASIGSMSLMSDNNSELALTGKFAFHANGRTKDKFKLGEGLIGQTALSQKSMALEDVGETDLRINSSMLEMQPRYVSMFPFLYEGKTLGVLELGKRHPFDKTQEAFLESSLESIAIAMNSARAQKRIKALLAETQKQSEELQVQQEELRQSNEELEEQTQKLKVQQEELQASNEELEEQAQVVEQKNKDLETARLDIELKAKQLEISSKYKSEFLANMSHELRTPLNSLLILSNDLAENKDANLTDEQVESAEVIAKSGKDLLLLINEILDLSKIEAGKMDLNIEEFNITDLTDMLQGNFKRLAQEKKIALDINIHEDLPLSIKTDRQRLEQIIKNLVSNAIKFTEKGAVKIDLNQSAAGYLQVSVSDTGIGIPKDKQQIIFEAFQQAEGGTARKYGGTGLGLSISRELSKFLHGEIKVSSTLGKGSTFTLVVPLEYGEVTDSSTEAAAKPRQAPPSNETVDPLNDQFLNYPAIKDDRTSIHDGHQTVLIIEDDQNFAQIVANQAHQKGFKYLTAATGEDGLKLAQDFVPQAIVLDIDLPGINGHAVLKMLKANPELRHIPVHVMSVNEKTIDPIKSGAVEYLTKPVTKNQLENAFSRIEGFINRKMKNLLIVEDDKNLRRSIVKLIADEDVNCIEAGSGADAVATLKKEQIDCMVLDIGLPDMNGFELIQTLEKDEMIKLPPIIVYTGRELSKEENNELQQYAETIIVKGVKSEERLLDETALFLHRMVKNLPSTKRQMITGLYDQDTIFADKKVLLVDDDMRNVWALSKVLGSKGLEILKAENGKTALNILKENKDVDLVLMDIMMPEMDGYECMREIRKLRQFKDLPIIALTAKAMKEDRQICIKAGANDYITKPVDVARLISMINIWIKK